MKKKKKKNKDIWVGLCAVVIVSVLGCSSVANKDATVGSWEQHH